MFLNIPQRILCLVSCQTDGIRDFPEFPEAFKVLPLTGSTTSGVCLYGNALKLVKPSRQYKAHLQLRQDLGVHTWNTEPFTLDELLRTGVGCWFVHLKQ